jgi:hypothetical protein
VENESNFQQFVSMMQVMHSMFTHPRFAPPRFPATQQRGGAGGLPKNPPLNYSGCIKCGDTSHFKVDCPKK